MKNRLGLTFLATGTLLLAAVSACADNDADPPPTTPATSSPTESKVTDGHRLDDLADRRRDR